MIRKARLAVAIAGLGAAAAGGWAVQSKPTFFAGLPEENAASRYPVRFALPAVRTETRSSSRSVEDTRSGEVRVDSLSGSAEEPAAGDMSALKAPDEPPPSSVESLAFDLASFGKSAPAGAAQTRAATSLQLGKERVGTVPLSLGQGSVVSVDRQALKTLAAKRDPALATTLDGLQGDLVTFDALRDRGVRIRYDALADAIVIDPPS